MLEEEPTSAACMLKDAFGPRLFAMAARRRIAEEVVEEKRLISRAVKYNLEIVASCEVLYHSISRRPLQDVLTCIRKKCTLASAGRRIQPNGELYLRSFVDFEGLFLDLPKAVEKTVEIAEACDFSLRQLRYRYPAEALPNGTSTAEQLRQLTFAGAAIRYKNHIPDPVVNQLERELALIEELDYPGYFLTMWEIVRFCRERNILCQGRGSAANSAVCFCLDITAVDPVRMELLFERFISRERAEPPDIDLDIEHERREEVIQHVYHKYGRDRAAMVASVIRYQSKSAIRDIGKVFELTEDELLKDSPTQSFSSPLSPSSLARELIGFPRHLSIHPGGFLLGSEPVHRLVPIENGTMPDRTVIQWDKDDIEALGLFKVDLLGLGALSHLHRTFDLIKSEHNLNLSMAVIPSDDRATFDMICRGETVGVFQIESRAQMAMLPRLKPKCFYDLVIEVSIVRPGPITGGMVHPYINRRNGLEAVTYPHPKLEPVLKKTLGVPLFQEQVMKLAMVAADYTPGEADQLRRDMAAWKKAGRIERHHNLLVSRMKQKGIDEEFANRVFEQIRGFGEYGFPESHAASFALISYASAYLRCHFPTEFVCGLLNSLPMGFYTSATIIEDAKRMGVTVKPVTVKKSEWNCSIENNAVRMGLKFIKGLGVKDFAAIASERVDSPFISVEDFARRTKIYKDTLSALAEAGAFDCFNLSRRQALWQVIGFVRENENTLNFPSNQKPPMFSELSDFETVSWDFACSGYSIHAHPLAPLRPQLSAIKLLCASDLSTQKNGSRIRFAGMVICRQRPSTAGGVTFMTLEDETGFANLVIWKNVYEAYEMLAQTASLLGVIGKIQAKDGVVHLIAEQLFLPKIAAPKSIQSRDFR